MYDHSSHVVTISVPGVLLAVPVPLQSGVLKMDTVCQLSWQLVAEKEHSLLPSCLPCRTTHRRQSSLEVVAWGACTQITFMNINYSKKTHCTQTKESCWREYSQFIPNTQYWVHSSMIHYVQNASCRLEHSVKRNNSEKYLLLRVKWICISLKLYWNVTVTSTAEKRRR